MPSVRSRGHSQAICRALVIAVAVLAAAPAGALAFSKSIWGPVFRNGKNQFPIYHQLGVSLFQMQLAWSAVAPRRPRHPTDPNDRAYRWPREIDQAIAQARRFHMRVLLQIQYSPQWAITPHNDRSWAPNNPSDFADFAAAASRRYPSVHLWMIWGEPNKVGEFQPLTPAQPRVPLNPDQQLAPHTYARLLDAAYGALKSVSPSNIVIGGCTFTGGTGADIPPLQWIQNLRLPNGRPPRMDMYSHNPFGYWEPTFSPPANETQYDYQNGEVQFIDLPWLASWLDRNLHHKVPILVSEWTLPTSEDREFPYHFSTQTAVRYIRDAFRISRRWHRIHGVGWINLYDTPGYAYGGLIQANGRKKPLFWAFAHG